MSLPELQPLPDAELIVSRFLRASARITDLADEVVTAFPAKAGPGPLLLIQRIGGAPPFSQPLVLDAADLQLDAYGGPKRTAFMLAAETRAVLTELEGTEQEEGTVAAVRFGAFRWLPDETFTPLRPRYVFDVTVHVRVAVVPAGAGV